MFVTLCYRVKNGGQFCMKRSMVFLVMLVCILCSFFLVTSCVAIPPLTPIERAAPSPRWFVGEYTNEWGDRLDMYFVTFDGELWVTYTAIGMTDERPIRDISFSHHRGFYFRLSSTMLASFTDRDAFIVIRNPDGSETQFNGTWGSSSRPYVTVPVSDELINALKQRDSIIRVSTEGRRFQFNFPEGFPEAYELLLQRER